MIQCWLLLVWDIDVNVTLLIKLSIYRDKWLLILYEEDYCTNKINICQSYILLCALTLDIIFSLTKLSARINWLLHLLLLLPCCQVRSKVSLIPKRREGLLLKFSLLKWTHTYEQEVMILIFCIRYLNNRL